MVDLPSKRMASAPIAPSQRVVPRRPAMVHRQPTRRPHRSRTSSSAAGPLGGRHGERSARLRTSRAQLNVDFACVAWRAPTSGCGRHEAGDGVRSSVRGDTSPFPPPERSAEWVTAAGEAAETRAAAAGSIDDRCAAGGPGHRAARDESSRRARSAGRASAHGGRSDAADCARAA
jgi:hypothetical protein